MQTKLVAYQELIKGQKFTIPTITGLQAGDEMTYEFLGFVQPDARTAPSPRVRYDGAGGVDGFMYLPGYVKVVEVADTRGRY